jgi:hypothetical protein
MSIELGEASAEVNRADARRGMTGKTAPLYVVCSPRRCVGKTLLSRLLTEFYVLGDRPVAAFDLADEGPQLADYLPQFTTIADIGDIRGQMAFFERLIADDDGARIIDLSHRTFMKFFTVAQEIGFFEEAYRRSIEPLILFIIDSDPNSPEVYATLRRRFTEASLLPVRNRTEASATSDDDMPPNAGIAPDSLQIPLLGFSRALIDKQSFSFCELWRATPTGHSDLLVDELRDWLEDIFWQFRNVELSLGCDYASTQIAAPGSSRPRYRQGQRNAQLLGGDSRAIDTPREVLKYAPKKARREDIPIEQFGDTIVGMLEKAAGQLRAAKDQINHLEGEIKRVQGRTVRAETWLQLIGKEIEEKLVEPAAASRSEIDDLVGRFQGQP